MSRKASLGPSAYVYVACYRTLLRAVDRRYDVRGYLLHDMVLLGLANHGRRPPARRCCYREFVQDEALDYLERMATWLLYGAMGLLGPNRIVSVSSTGAD